MSSITDDVQHFVRNPLDEITSKFERACIPYNFVTLESINMDTSDLKVILDPLDFLLNSFTVYALFKAVPSTSNRNMVARINSLRNRINSKSINPKHLKPLVRSIFSKAADTEVWFQLISVLDIFEPHSTSDTFTSSLNYPDVCHRQTAAPYKGKDQKVEILKEALRTELNGTIFEDVGGFYEKYFEMTPWANQCQKIADSFVNRKFKARFRFPKKPTESNVWRWVHRIQAEFIESYKAPTVTPSDKSASSKKEKTFPLRSNKFRTTSAWQFEGSESPRQVDFFFKSRKHAVGTPHDWRDVLVLGELTSSSVGVWKSKFLQLSVYMREVFMAQPLRRFVHGFLLFGTKLQLWVFDRSGPMSTGFIDIGENPEKLIYVITAYMLMSDNELGLDSNFVQEHDRTLIKVKEPETDKWLMLTLEPFPFIVQRSIVSRGRTVYRGLYESFVVKISWRAVGRMSEVELLGKSRSIRGVATLIGSLDMEKISELRDGLTFTKAMQREIQPDEEPMTTPHDLLQPETSNQEGIVQPSGGVKRKSASSAGDSQQSKRSCVSSIPRQARTNAAVASMRKGGTSASKRAPGKLTALKNSTPTINQSLNQGSTSSGSKRSRNDGEMNVDAPNVPERELKKLRITSSTGGPLPEASAGPLPASNAADATVLDVPDVVVVDVNASPKISNMSTTESSLFYRDRLQSIIASKPSGRAIGEDTSPLDLLCGLRDAIKGHRSLFLDARILHRDVSVNNIILTDPKTNDDCCGVLIDLDLAMSLDDPNAAASSHILTGTMEFMALGILRANLTRTNAGIKHSYRHDLESFFYVLVSTSMRFGWGDKKATHLGLLGTWYKGTVQSMYNAKFTAIHVDSFESNVLSGFSAKFECLKDVAKKMRASLFDRGCGFWLGEDHHPETLYNPILLDLESEIAKMECDYA